MRPSDPERTARARRLRRDGTDAETRLWNCLRARQLGGCKFVRQGPVGRYFVDFLCRERRLVVELDGGQHSENPRDAERDAALAKLGYRVVRIWNNEVMSNIDGVLEMLLIELRAEPAPHPPASRAPPSPRKRGEA